MSSSGIDNVVARMDTLFARWEAAGDSRAVFLCSYRDITARMQAAVAGRGFEDNAWMESLDATFAGLYFDAVDAEESGSGALPQCWRIAFRLARRKASTVLEDLLLGMNAHIHHDLAIALYQMGLDPARRALRQRDHEKVNDILAGMIDRVQKDVCRRYSWSLSFLDRLGRADELLTDVGIRLERAKAWDRAVELADAPDEAARGRLLVRLDEATSARALLLAAPSAGPAGPLRLLRRWDRRLAR